MRSRWEVPIPSPTKMMTFYGPQSRAAGTFVCSFWLSPAVAFFVLASLLSHHLRISPPVARLGSIWKGQVATHPGGSTSTLVSLSVLRQTAALGVPSVSLRWAPQPLSPLVFCACAINTQDLPR